MSSSSWVPPKPSHLAALACEAWDKIARECLDAGIELSTKGDVLERYAVTWVLWLECQANLRRESQVVTVEKTSTVDGKTVVEKSTQRNPRMTDYHQLTRAIGYLRSELGLTPRKSATLEVATAPRKTRVRILRHG